MHDLVEYLTDLCRLTKRRRRRTTSTISTMTPTYLLVFTLATIWIPVHSTTLTLSLSY